MSIAVAICIIKLSYSPTQVSCTGTAQAPWLVLSSRLPGDSWGGSASARSHPGTVIAVEMNGWLHSHVREQPWHHVNHLCSQQSRTLFKNRPCLTTKV